MTPPKYGTEFGEYIITLTNGERIKAYGAFCMFSTLVYHIGDDAVKSINFELIQSIDKATHMTPLPVFECLYVAKFKPQSPFWIRQECEGYARIIVMTGIYLNLSAN